MRIQTHIAKARYRDFRPHYRAILRFRDRALGDIASAAPTPNRIRGALQISRPWPEQQQEPKVTCCGMKKSSPAVDEELEALESSEQAVEPQKLEPIKEESTTGSEQLKRDSSSESQEVQQAETK